METAFKYIVYKTTNIVNGKIYIGVHKTNNPDKFDGYIGCGVYINKFKFNKNKTIFLRAVIKYGAKNFVRSTLKIFNNLDDALDLERWLVDQSFIDNPNTYNMILGGNIRPPSNTKAVYMYDLHGNYITKFESISSASIFIYGNAKNSGCITRAIKQKMLCKKEYRFSYNYQININEYLPKTMEKLKMKFSNSLNIERNFAYPLKVGVYSKEGKLIQIFNSINQCKLNGYKNAQFVLNGKRKTCNGCIIKYI